jgi:hypothetical protein
MTRAEAEKLRRPPSQPAETRFPLVIIGQGGYARVVTERDIPLPRGNDARSGAVEDARPDRVFLWIFGAALAWLVAEVACP